MFFSKENTLHNRWDKLHQQAVLSVIETGFGQGLISLILSNNFFPLNRQS